MQHGGYDNESECARPNEGEAINNDKTSKWNSAPPETEIDLDERVQFGDRATQFVVL